jgi:hypothetical protein
MNDSTRMRSLLQAAIDLADAALSDPTPERIKAVRQFATPRTTIWEKESK